MANPDIKLLIGPKGGASPSGESAVEIRQALQTALSGKNGVKVNVRLTSNAANSLRKEIQKALNANGGIEAKIKGQIAGAVSKGTTKIADVSKRAADNAQKKAAEDKRAAISVQSRAALNAQNFEKYLQGVSAKGHMDYAGQINKIRELYRIAEKNGLKDSLQDSDSAARQLKATFKDLGYESGNVFTYIENKMKSFMVYLVSSKLTNALIKGVRDGVTAVKELNAEMTQLRIVTGANQAQMDKFLDSAIAKAKNVGSSVTDMLNSTTVYARLGYSMDESADLAEYTAMLQNVGDIDVESSQNAITAIVKAYDVGAHQIEATMDKMVTVGNNFPISVRQLAEGMNNAGSALSSSGNSFDQSLALLAAANTTVQNISKSSTGLRTIAARIRNTKTELDELGEAITDAEYDNLVQSLTRASVSLTDAKGELRSTYDILQDIANVWGNMTKNDQAALAETLAGTRQQNIFYSLINQFNEASKAMDAMTSSAGAMSSANSVYMESVGAKADRMEASFQELSSTLLDSSIIGRLYDFGNAALNAVSAFDAWPAKIALVAAGLPTLIGLFREFKHMPLIESIGGSFKDLARPKMTGRNWNWANHLEEAA